VAFIDPTFVVVSFVLASNQSQIQRAKTLATIQEQTVENSSTGILCETQIIVTIIFFSYNESSRCGSIGGGVGSNALMTELCLMIPRVGEPGGLWASAKAACTFGAKDTLRLRVRGGGGGDADADEPTDSIS
jgi:hypothetical protein